MGDFRGGSVGSRRYGGMHGRRLCEEGGSNYGWHGGCYMGRGRVKGNPMAHIYIYLDNLVSRLFSCITCRMLTEHDYYTHRYILYLHNMPLYLFSLFFISRYD